VQGSSSVYFVDVQDNDASDGNPVTLGANSVKGSNTPGWATGVLAPALGAAGLALLGHVFSGGLDVTTLESEKGSVCGKPRWASRWMLAGVR
jgi:hypothetical protein